MKKQEIIVQLNKVHAEFVAYIDILTEDDFLFHPLDKWSAGQQLDHIIRSVKPVSKALLLPQFLLKYKFGKANRSSRTFVQLREKYNLKLSEGGRAFGGFIPDSSNFKNKSPLIKKLGQTQKNLISRLDRYTEQELDIVILPHPLLGKLTMREMIYFTIFHCEHHHQNAIKTLAHK